MQNRKTIKMITKKKKQTER